MVFKWPFIFIYCYLKVIGIFLVILIDFLREQWDSVSYKKVGDMLGKQMINAIISQFFIVFIIV